MAQGRHRPVIKGWFLQFQVAVKLMGKAPSAFGKNGLGILRGPPFVAAPEVSFPQAVEEQEPADSEEE